MEQVRTVNVGIIGLGTVGGGCARLIAKHRDSYRKAYGVDLALRRACARHPERARELGLSEGVFTTDWHEVTADPAVDIVIEVIGGEHPAREIILDAIAHGKHVVTANKSLLGQQVDELADAAAAAGVQIRCEAACAGGIPIVNALEHALVGNEILTIAGIMNGTTNYILSRMDAEGLDFAEVLAQAQELGYAEADPTADVDGFDAAAKLAILSSIAFHTRVTTADIACEGIRGVSAADIEQARALGMKIKLLACGRKTERGVDVRVHPAMIPSGHQLAAVSGAMNAVIAVGDAVGETMFYGAGAGAFPTASAVVGDALELAWPLARGIAAPAEREPYGRVEPIVPIEELETRFYLRLRVRDRAGALAPVVAAFAEAGISVSDINQVADHASAGQAGVGGTADMAAAADVEGAASVGAGADTAADFDAVASSGVATGTAAGGADTVVAAGAGADPVTAADIETAVDNETGATHAGASAGDATENGAGSAVAAGTSAHGEAIPTGAEAVEETCSVVFLTHRARQRDMDAVCHRLAHLSEVAEVASVIRIEDVERWCDGVEAN